MRILVACEYSGRVRDAFLAQGHDAMSCDLLPTDVPGPHYEGDVRDVLYDGWDMLIGHPTCTYLTNAGSGHMYLGKGKEQKAALGYQIDQERWKNMEDGAAFFNLLWNAPIPRICIENPIMHGWGVERVGGKATQFVQPYMFGEPRSKSTGLRLKNLPLLVETDNVKEYMDTLPKKVSHEVHYTSPGKDRWKKRSTTYKGIAQAMADQWGHLPVLENTELETKEAA